MTYKAFEDFYRSADIKHLVLHDHNGTLVSPPFGTAQSKDYSDFLIINEDAISFINLNLPHATSKFNAIETIEDSIWCIPYAIYDNFNLVLQIKNGQPIYHKINYPGRGQFYSIATDGKTALSFPLGYEETSFSLYINNDKVDTIEMPKVPYSKLHMGTVYCNGKFWSAPRSDLLDHLPGDGYCEILGFDHNAISRHHINFSNTHNTRKYTDIVVHNDRLYSLPFGEQTGTTEIIEFDTNTLDYKLYNISEHDFKKKYNAFTIVGNKIIGLPYGDETSLDSQWGIVFDLTTKKYEHFNIGDELSFGGKYRYRSCVSFNETAIFFPSGTPSCPIIKVDQNLNLTKISVHDTLLGRPIIHNGRVKAIGYELTTKKHYLYSFDEHLDYEKRFLI